METLAGSYLVRQGVVFKVIRVLLSAFINIRRKGLLALRGRGPAVVTCLTTAVVAFWPQV